MQYNQTLFGEMASTAREIAELFADIDARQGAPPPCVLPTRLGGSRLPALLA